jgi:hypothetical protein
LKLPKLPEAGDKPRTLKQTVHASTPVALTVMATLLAGLSSGEMTRSQYFRSLAVQCQAKASDQWAYYQAQRSRSVEAVNTLDLLMATAHPAPLDKSKLLAATTDADLHSLLDAPQADMVFSIGPMQLPAAADKPLADKSVQDALDEVYNNKTESEMTPLLRQITDQQMAAAEQIPVDNLNAFDASIDPISKSLDKLRTMFGSGAMQPDIAAARLRFSAARYDREAAYNQKSALLYEVEVHRNGIESDRRKVRSSNFFYGMLIAQAAVMIATFSLAGQKPGALWTLAALFGGAAAAFGGYVYFWF